MEKIIIRREIPENIAYLDHLHPLLRRIYGARSINSVNDLSRNLNSLLPFNTLLGINQATSRLVTALKEQEHILVVGDFDTDGATSTALAISALHAMGAKQVSYIVPNRFEYGYGLTPEIVDVAKQQNPSLLITVDSGISSHAGVAHANELGIDVIITDHHLPAKELPTACAIVNPNQVGDQFPSKCIAGVGVIFYVMLALRAHLSRLDWFENQNMPCPNMAQFLDLVALGTVADVVPLDKNNRILIHQGLQRIRAGKARVGINALLQVSGRRSESLRASDLGFALGPRLNSAGRLDDMSVGIACLLAEKESVAFEIAIQLDDLNKERRVIEKQMQEEASAAVEELNLENKQLPCGVCLYQEDWHQGVVGLVASRIKEKVHRPVIAFAKVDNEMLKGSARSIPGLHICDVLGAIATKQPQLISKFGGHAMAAGLSLPLSSYEAFSEAFAAEVKEQVTEKDLQPKLISDGELLDHEFSLEIAELLRNAGPWGQGFPEPLFDGKFKLIGQRIVGQRHLKLILQPTDTDRYLDGIAFNVNLDKWPNYHCDNVYIVYRLDINNYQGRCKLQLLVEDIRTA